MQYVFLWASGTPNSRTAPGSPHFSYATAFGLNFDLTRAVSQDHSFQIKTTERKATQARRQVLMFERAKCILWGEDFCFFVCLKQFFLGTTKIGVAQKVWERTSPACLRA